ncbi:MAG: argininosuccinate lyase [Actinomycetota bacterium]
MSLWGGRFSTGPEQSVFALSRSTHFDWRLAPYDVRASLAHLSLLESKKLVTATDGLAIRNALKELESQVAEGTFAFSELDEDVHSALERGLTEQLGPIGGALRAGRSRNDQVATDLKLFSIDHLLHVAGLVLQLQSAILEKAQEYANTASPGFTHLQHAQPVSLGHEIAKHAHALQRDVERIRDWHTRTLTSPLGAGALAGTSLGLDPEITAKELGFTSPALNSIDAVSDRDFVAEALFILALIGVHLSRIGEEWTLWCTTEFGWAKIGDAYATGSSIMPQKKNPDVAELVRGKSGRLIGNLTSLLVVLKGLPFAYNRDLQEDKEPLFDSIDTLILVLPPLTGMIASTTFEKERISQSAPAGFSLATEIADFLVRKGIPFALAHEAAGKCVRVCEVEGVDLHDLSDLQLQSVHPDLTPDVRAFLTVESALASRDSINGTSPQAVTSQIEKLKAEVARESAWFARESDRFSGMMGR